MLDWARKQEDGGEFLGTFKEKNFREVEKGRTSREYFANQLYLLLRGRQG